MNPICTAASDMPTTLALKDSFDRIPRKLNARASRSRSGCDARYSGSPPGYTKLMVMAVPTAPKIIENNARSTKLAYVKCVSYDARTEPQSFNSISK